MNGSNQEVSMDKHITFVAVLNIGFGALGILIAIASFIAIVGGGLISGDREAIEITSIVGTVIAGFFLVTSIPEIIGGIGLLNRRPWARIVILIVAVLDLFCIPIGTIIGVYEIWVLMQEETIGILEKKGSV